MIFLKSRFLFELNWTKQNNLVRFDSFQQALYFCNFCYFQLLYTEPHTKRNRFLQPATKWLGKISHLELCQAKFIERNFFRETWTETLKHFFLFVSEILKIWEKL